MKPDSGDLWLGTLRHFRNTISVGFGRIIAQILNLLIIPFILKYVSPAEYGAFTLLQIYSMIYGVVISLGISTVFLAKYRAADAAGNGTHRLLGSCLTQQAIFGGLLLIIGIYFAEPVSRILIGNASPYILMYLLISEYFTNHIIIFGRWQILTNRHWQTSLSAVLRTTIFLLLSLFLVGYMQRGISGLALADMIAELIVFLLNVGFAKGKFIIGFSLDDVKSVIKLGIPAAPETIFFWLIVSMPLYFLRQGGNADAAGSFSLAWRICAPVDVLGNSLASGAARQFLESCNRQIESNLRRLYRNSLEILLLSLVSLNLVGVEFLRIFFSTAYYGAGMLLPFISLGYYFLSLYYFEWLGISGTMRTAGLSYSSGIGVLLGMMVPLLSGYLPGEIAASTGFALSFAGMWLTARLIRRGVHFGKAWQLISYGIFMTVLVMGINLFTDRLALHTIYILIVLVFLCIMVGFLELCLRVRERRMDSGGVFLWHDLPNYRIINSLVENPQNILDIGCSEGYYLGEVQTQFKVGVDKIFHRLAHGRRNYPDVYFICADATALPFKITTFSTVTMIGVLPYISNPVPALLEAERVLSSGGKFVCSTVKNGFFYRIINISGWRHQINYTDQREIGDWLKSMTYKDVTMFEKGLFLSPIFSSLFSISSIFDRKILRSKSVTGPLGILFREFTNPILNWEYRHDKNKGYQIFVRAIKR